MKALPQVNESTFRERVLTRSCPVVVLFSKPGCTACISARAAVKKFASTYAGRVPVYTADITMNRQLSATYCHGGVPLVVVFHRGQEVWRRVGGSVKAEMISTWVDDLLPDAAA